MMKRVSWFIAGAAAGAGGSLYARRKVRRTARTLAPGNVARVATDRARQRGRAVVDAVREGRSVMVAKEAEMKAIRDGHPQGGRLRHRERPAQGDGASVERLDDWRVRPGGRLRSRR